MCAVAGCAEPIEPLMLAGAAERMPSLLAAEDASGMDVWIAKRARSNSEQKLRAGSLEALPMRVPEARESLRGRPGHTIAARVSERLPSLEAAIRIWPALAVASPRGTAPAAAAAMWLPPSLA